MSSIKFDQDLHPVGNNSSFGLFVGSLAWIIV